MRTYTFVNQKGGVGKTTTAINLGAYLSRLGQQVLLIDIDPQANATVCLGIDHRTVPLGTYDLMIGNQPVAECVMHSNRLNLSLGCYGMMPIPGSFNHWLLQPGKNRIYVCLIFLQV